MKVLMVVTALVAVVSGQFHFNGRSNGNGGSSPVYGPPQTDFEQSQQPLQQDAYQPQLFRHVFVHVAPDEPADEQARTVKIPGGDKHVNIIFVKTPSQSSSAQTEVILPEADQQKNLVYVLLKKNEAESNIKIRRPKAKQPEKPEVYFIRYKDQEQAQNGPGGYQQGASGNGNGHHNGNGNGHHNGNGNGNGHHNGNGNGHHSGNGNGNGHHSGNGNGNGHHNGNGNGNGHHSNGNSGYSEAGRYTPAQAPGIIRSQSDSPSSGYGVPH